MGLRRYFQRYRYRPREQRIKPANSPVESPIWKLLASLLHVAAYQGAKKITFGMPQGRTFTEEEVKEILQQHQEVSASLSVTRESFSGSSLSTAKGSDTARIQRRDGLPYIPVWFFENGLWYRPLSYGISLELYPHLQFYLLEGLVSLETPSGQAQPRKWIEYAADANEGARSFAEVKLFYEENLSMTIEILSTREELIDVCVSQSTSGWRPRV